MYNFSALTATFIYDQILELERCGVENHVLAVRRLNEKSRPFSRVQIVPLPPPYHPARAARKISSWLRLEAARDRLTIGLHPKRLAQSLENLKPDLVHAHFGSAAIMVAPIAARLNIPLVVSFYGYDISRLARRRTWVKRYVKLWAEASAVAVLSKHMEDRADALGCPTSKLNIVHLGKCLRDYPFVVRRGPIKQFLSVGSLFEKKGHIDLLMGFRELLLADEELTLKIIGEGRQRPLLEEYIAKNGLQERVHLLGALGHDEVQNELRRADAFVLSSKTAEDGDEEGTPTVFMEAQAVGLPCIGTWHAGVPETLPIDNHWLLAEPGNVGSIASRLRALLSCSDSEVRTICERGRAHVEAQFNIEIEMQKLTEIYARALSS